MKDVIGLRTDLAQSADQIRTGRRAARAARGPDREQIDKALRAAGKVQRAGYLALALTRGVPYRNVEFASRGPLLAKLAAAVLRVLQAYVPSTKLTMVDVVDWMNTPASVARLKAAVTVETESRERRRASRQHDAEVYADVRAMAARRPLKAARMVGAARGTDERVRAAVAAPASEEHPFDDVVDPPAEQARRGR